MRSDPSRVDSMFVVTSAISQSFPTSAASTVCVHSNRTSPSLPLTIEMGGTVNAPATDAPTNANPHASTARRKNLMAPPFTRSTTTALAIARPAIR